MTREDRLAQSRIVDMEDMDRDDICGHIKKDGRPCLQPAGMGTDHKGSGFCKYHDQPRVRRHGRYSSKKSGSALEMYLEMLEDPEMTSIDDEIALLRATVSEIDEMLEEVRDVNDGKLLPDAILLEKGFDDMDRKAVLKLISQKTDVVKAIAALVERKKKLEEGRMVSVKQVEEVLAQVAYIIKQNCGECNRLERLAEEFAQISITQGA